ncbi:MAG: type IV secretion protein Rhs, partial [Coleofasciculus sp. C2-GNP5-27]
GFEHGDIHHPYVIGGVWNGKDKPPEAVTDSVMDGKVRLRTLKTRTGHTLQFVEEDKGSSKKGVYLDTVYGHHLHLNDTQQFTEAKTKNGHYLRLDDKNKKAEVKTQNGHYVLLDDRGGTIELKCGGTTITMSERGNSITIKGTSITLDAKKIDIKATGPVAVTGKPIKLN